MEYDKKEQKTERYYRYEERKRTIEERKEKETYRSEKEIRVSDSGRDRRGIGLATIRWWEGKGNSWSSVRG